MDLAIGVAVGNEDVARSVRAVTPAVLRGGSLITCGVIATMCCDAPADVRASDTFA